MKSKCRWKTVNTVSRTAFLDGSNKFKTGFEEANTKGISILKARMKECVTDNEHESNETECLKKQITVEISYQEFQLMFEQYIPNEIVPIESIVRAYLIDVCKGKQQTKHFRKATYKEVWNHVYPRRQFGRGNTNEVVGWIVKISDNDVLRNLPPLNSIVVRGDTAMPGVSWDEWFSNQKSNCLFSNVLEAQEMCWKKWKKK